MEKMEQWIQEFESWEKSGLTRTEYCRTKEIPVSTFDYWRKRVKDKESGTRTGMVKLPLEMRSPGSGFRLEIARGKFLHIPENYHKEALARLVLDLREIFP